MSFRFALTLAACAALSAPPAVAAQWETVASAGGDRVEIDRSRIKRSAPNRATAWSRINRDGLYIDDLGLRYTTIEAYNRYDCAKGSFTILKRVWRRNGEQVRDEPIAKPVELTVEAGSSDAQILAEACGHAAAPSAAAPGDKPGVMHADMRTAGDAAKAKLQSVAESRGEKADSPGEKKAASEKTPAEKPVEKTAGEKPRFIELPKIDKSKAEDPNKAVASKDAPAAKDSKPVAAAAKKPEPIKELPKGAGVSAEKFLQSASRQEVERAYATSGPRKAVRRASAAAIEHKDIHWGYEGDGAPAHWNKLNPKNAACAQGKRQSPIDIREGIIKVDLEPIRFNYKLSQFRVSDNGHTIQITVGEGSTISVMGRTFELVQFHFHRPSEERVRGKSFDMVAHLVHRDDDGRLAVVAVLMERSGVEHPLIQALWNNMPLEQGMDVEPNLAIDLNRILPEDRSYYTYMGSLTTPPCTEEVLWMVLKKPIGISDQQISIFSRLYRNNARPVQPVNARLVKESR